MRNLLLLAAIFSVPSLLLASNVQLETSKSVNGTHEAATSVMSLFQMTFSTLFADKCFERHFVSESERDQVLSKIIAFQHFETIDQLKEEGHGKLIMSDFSKREIEYNLEQSPFLEILLNVSSLDPKHRMLNLLSGNEGFSEIPFKVRRFVAAKKLWTAPCSKAWTTHSTFALPNIGSLSLFLSSFHEKFEMFKESLVEIEPSVVAEACVKIVLGIDCIKLSVNDQMCLLGSLAALFPKSLIVSNACLLHNYLSFDSSISEIIDAAYFQCPHNESMVFNALLSSPKHVFASWCMKVLKRQRFSLVHIKFSQPHLLFDDVFLRTHDISVEERDVVLRSYQPENLCTALSRPDLKNEDVYALAEWIINSKIDLSTLSFSDLVAIYSLDSDDDQGALANRYFYLLKSKYKGLEAFVKVLLGIKYAWRLTDGKKTALLKHLDPERLEPFIADLNNRKTLMVRAMSSINQYETYILAKGFLDSDLQLLAEAYLEHSKECKWLHLNRPQTNLVVHALADCIGDDIEKLKNLQNFPKDYKAMMFLLTDHDAIVDCLSGFAKKLDLIPFLSKIDFGSQTKAARAAERIHKCQKQRLSDAI